MSAATIRYEAADGIARLVIAQPAKMNAMSFEMWSMLPDCVARAEADPAVRAIVLTGEGERAFCAGADISQFGERRTGDEAVAAYEFCAGGSRFRLPAARLGLGYPFSGVRLLAQKVGMPAAADIALSARILDAAEAERLGLVNKTWGPADFEAEIAAYLAQIAVNAPLTLQAMKRALLELARPEAEQDAAAVDALVQACFRSADYKEGQAAFRDKRDPKFLGE